MRSPLCSKNLTVDRPHNEQDGQWNFSRSGNTVRTVSAVHALPGCASPCLILICAYSISRTHESNFGLSDWTGKGPHNGMSEGFASHMNEGSTSHMQLHLVCNWPCMPWPCQMPTGHCTLTCEQHEPSQSFIPILSDLTTSGRCKCFEFAGAKATWQLDIVDLRHFVKYAKMIATNAILYPADKW